jgi:glycosyltransferase involved in cell wall biosynthesis
LSFPHYQFHKGLLKDGHSSIILSAKGDVSEKEIILLNKGSLIPYFGISRFVRKVFFEIIKNNTTNYYYPEWNLDGITKKQIIKKIPYKPDIIIAYWSKFAFNQKLIYELSKYYNVPVLFFMMDMAPMTGGCHYAYDCTNYYENCGNCPALKSNRKKDLSYHTLNFKKKYIEKTDITLIAGTTTLINQSNKSSLWKYKSIEQLMISVNENIYQPLDKKTIKLELGIPADKKVIFFGAASLSEKRKGISYLMEALNMLNHNIDEHELKDNILILIAGNNLTGIDIPFEYKYLGYLRTETELAKAYQACDLFVCPSIEDSGPLMINQAIMSGRPVVSFDMGVAPDLVHTGVTGFRARLKDSGELAKGMEILLKLNEDEWNVMSDRCRELALEKCALSNQTDRILEVIKRVIDCHGRNKD